MNECSVLFIGDGELQTSLKKKCQQVTQQRNTNLSERLTIDSGYINLEKKMILLLLLMVCDRRTIR